MDACGLLVLGGHRCGTSMTAGLLALHGVFLGETLPPGRNNLKGYWENTAVNEANETLLARLGIGWDWPYPLPVSVSRMDSSELNDLGALFPRALAPFAGQALWAVKDPRLCRLLPFWRPFLARLGTLRGIVAVRRPEGACRSLERRDRMGRRWALSLWLHHVLDAIHHLGDIPWIALDYESLLAAPREGMDGLARALELRLPRRPEDEELHNFADPGLLHHAQESTHTGDKLEMRCRELYELLKNRHLARPDAELLRFAAALRAEMTDARRFDPEPAREMYGELLRLRAYKHSIEHGR